METAAIAKEILYAKQKAFDFKDKPGKQLAYVLSEDRSEGICRPLRNLAGELVRDPGEQVAVFANIIRIFIRPHRWIWII